MLLFHDFAGEVPSQHQNVIGFAIQQLLRREDWQVITRHKPALLELIQIDYVIEQFFIDITESEQSGCLGRCCIAGDRLAFVTAAMNSNSDIS